MSNLEKIIKVIDENKEMLHNEVEAEKTKINDCNVIICNELVHLYPMSHGNVDKMQAIWSRTLQDVFWLGWITGAKGADDRYLKEFCNEVEQSLALAFNAGRDYVKIKP